MRIRTQKLGAGCQRDYLAIKRWLYENDVTITAIAAEAGVDRSVVSHTIWGMVNNRKALTALVKRGCPAEILSLPDDMRGREYATN